ncbi:hypothetical protein ACI7BZ_20375 [Xanthobacter sp. AM11]|uniref:hypothetical protein n=1 Tax=Xanthobacter sp. AM11 TaxID=3380643 RepID=UPI0039BEDB5F
MSAVTYTDRSFSGARKAVSAAKAEGANKGFWARLMDAIIAARTEQAERELSRYVQVHGRDPIA